MNRASVVLTTFLIVIPAVIILLWLGTWQVQRAQWKSSLIEMRELNYSQEPVELPVRDRLLERAGWRRVSANGTFDHSREFHLWSIRDGGAGYDILTPLRSSGVGTAEILVDRGWVPMRLKDAVARAEGQIAGEVTVTGYVRNDLDVRRTATPENEPEGNIWYYVDYGAMGARDGVFYRPGVLIADSSPNPGGWPLGAEGLPELPNNHVGYAFTWYSLAVAAVVIWVMAIRRSRAPKQAESTEPKITA